MIHFVKYNLIGLLNTGITLLVVWVLHQWLNMPVVPANFLGYVAGGANSFLWNKHWNFQSKGALKTELLRFLVVFGISYFLNLGVLLAAEWFLLHSMALQPFLANIHSWCKPGYLAHVVANVVYVIVSFGMYKKWVFTHRNSG